MKRGKKRNPEFSMAMMRRIFKRAGGKSSVEAKEHLLSILNELASEIARYSVRYARNAGKSTVATEDVRNATRWVLGARKVGKAEEIR